MSLAYRATVFARSIVTGGIPTETAVLVPSSGSSHNNPFQVTTLPSLSGFQPYMSLPKGQKCALSLPSTKLTVGQITFDVMDQRLTPGGSNFVRWASAYLADSTKRLQLIGRKVVVEESVDGGGSWSCFFVGRISAIALANALQYTLTISDSVEDMKRNIFIPNTPPDVEYCTTELLHPFGVSKPIFDAPVADVIQGLVISQDSYQGQSRLGIEVLGVGSDLGTPSHRLWTALANQLSNSFVSTVPTQVPSVLAFAGLDTLTTTGILVNISSQPDTIEGQMALSTYGPQTSDSPTQGSKYLNGLSVFAKPSGSAGYVPATNYALNSQVFFQILSSNPAYYLGPKHPFQVVKDIFDGKFFAATGSNGSLITIPYDSTLTDLIADTSFPMATYRITQQMTVVDFLEKNVLPVYSVGYATKPVYNGSSGDSVVTFFKTTLPTSSSFESLATLDNDTDIIADNKITWTAGVPLSQLSYTYYVDSYNPLLNQANTNSNSTFIEAAFPIITIDSDTNLPNNVLTIDALGVRSGPQPLTTGFASGSPSSFSDAYSLVQPILRRWVFGSPGLSLQCRRTSTVMASEVGDWLLVDVDKMPNQANNQRGGTRLMQVTQKSEQLSTVTLQLIDGALNTSSLAPTVGALTAIDSTVAPLIALPVTGSGLINFQILAGAIGEPNPNVTDTRWRTVDTKAVSSAIAMVWFDAHYGQRVWGRARNEGLANGDIALPSDWVTAGNHVDVAYLDPPTNLDVGHITSKSALASWSTASAHPIEVLFASPATASLSLIAQLQGGTIQYVLNGLDTYASPTQSVGVRHTDLIGGYSPTVSASFIAVNPPDQLSPPRFLEIFLGS